MNAGETIVWTISIICFTIVVLFVIHLKYGDRDKD